MCLMYLYKITIYVSVIHLTSSVNALSLTSGAERGNDDKNFNISVVPNAVVAKINEHDKQITNIDNIDNISITSDCTVFAAVAINDSVSNSTNSVAPTKQFDGNRSKYFYYSLINKAKGNRSKIAAQIKGAYGLTESGDTDEDFKLMGSSDLRKLLLKYDSDEGNSCLLDNIKNELLWWAYPNGTLKTLGMKYSKTSYLDLSSRNITSDEEFLSKMPVSSGFLASSKIVIFSAAYNTISVAPYKTLSTIRKSLKFLTLRGNQFTAFTSEMLDEGVAWATFPVLPELLELDISNCSIEYITKEAFKNVTNIRRLFISHNKIMTVPNDSFYYIQKVQYLDLSFTNVFHINYQLSVQTIEMLLRLIYGLKIQSFTFKMLPNLIYLDLSHTKITRNSAAAFTHLSDKLKYLSLCYTAFPMVGNAFFKNTALEGLDLSGNPFVSYNIVDDAFEGVADSLQYLYFEYSNLKELVWLKGLTKLRILGLSGNNINSVSTEIFQPLTSLQVLDLSSNHIGNWYKSAFSNNSQLRVLNLRDNNINIITTEMLKDFKELEYISLADNNFLCDCLLRDLIEIAINNNKEPDCAYELFSNKAVQISNDLNINKKLVSLNKTELKTLLHNELPSINTMNVQQLLWTRYASMLEKSYRNVKNHGRLNNIYRYNFVNDAYHFFKCPKPLPFLIGNKLNVTSLKFQLIDYDEEHYWCYNETEQLHLGDLNCQTSKINEDFAKKLHIMTTVVTVIVASVVGITILGVIIYIKRWHIHYYYSSIKSAALLSIASKESSDQFNCLAEQDPNMLYDIFISYCQSDRQWVLDELLPNVEESADISICLHERDFQIGVTILDNIISCMDRSRALMLIISTKFLLSHWCQFEMYLAQHRIFEASKEHLIVVFLEDIPRNKRPKTLQYLMDVKTYIKWPTDKDNKPRIEERKLFWKRLKRSLEYIGISTENSRV